MRHKSFGRLPLQCNASGAKHIDCTASDTNILSNTPPNCATINYTYICGASVETRLKTLHLSVHLAVLAYPLWLRRNFDLGCHVDRRHPLVNGAPLALDEIQIWKEGNMRIAINVRSTITLSKY